MTEVKPPAWLQSAEFLISAAQAKQFPLDEGIEIAFIGRSNVGKSSVLNALTARRQLARTSKTPGRTQLINFFKCTDNIRLVDLPGYGYAKVSQSMRQQWDKLIADYLETRQCLRGCVLIMDARHPLKEMDQQILQWGQRSEVTMLLLLNKIDKLSKQEQQKALNIVKKETRMCKDITIELFSAVKKSNILRIYQQLSLWCDSLF